MAIKKIKVKNFKSFKDLELSLGKVNIFIGTNGSGKSNFVDIIRFLKDIANHGLENSISMHGGSEYLRNIKIGYKDFFTLEIAYDESALQAVGINYINKQILEESYTFAIEFNENTLGFKIADDKLRSRNKSLDGSIWQNIMSNDQGKVHVHDPSSQNPSDIIYGVGNFTIPSKSIMLGYLPEQYLHLASIVDKISIYDFNPKFSKEAVPIFAKIDLEENGSNLVIVIKKILDDPEKKRMFMNLVSYLLPYVEDIKVDKFTETHYFLRIKETYSDKHYLPAPLISDGTINALGLIVALYFQESPLVIIEEPDKGFHPSLISRVIDMMRDAAENGDKQIIVTTHSPEMVRHADKKDIFLVSRDEDGFSHVTRPARKKDVRTFLKNGMRLEELYVNELLEI